MLKIWALSLIAVASLTACGGGSDNSADSSTAPTPVAVTFTTSNYQQAAQEAFASSDAVKALPIGVQTADSSSLLRLGKEQFLKFRELRNAAVVQPTGVTSTTTYTCAVSGNVTISYNVASSYVETPGDTFTSSYNNCVEASFSINGVLVGTVLPLPQSGTIPDWRASLDYRNVTVANNSASVVGNGALVFSEKSSPAIPEYEAGMSTTSFAVTATFGTTSYTRALTNFSASYKNTSTNTTERMDGTVTSSALGGRYVTLQTVTPFVTTGADAYPSSGQIVLFGSGGGKVRVTALSSSYVRIELDANGDNNYETLIQKLWTAA